MPSRKALFDGTGSWRSALVDEDGETAISVKLCKNGRASRRTRISFH